MKRVFLILALIIGFAINSEATVRYFSYANGNDSTGNGTTGTPYKTINKCFAVSSAGDECRFEKSTITTLSGTLTFTNGSASVATSVDLTGSVAAGDVVSKNSGLEGWWYVQSINATTITLKYQYWGLSGSGSAVTGYKITPTILSGQDDCNNSAGGSYGNLIKVSGGWNLSNTTQEGLTSVAYNGMPYLCYYASYYEMSKFIFTNYSTGYNSTWGTMYGKFGGWYIHDLFFAAGGNQYSQFYVDSNTYGGDSGTFENIVAAGGSDNDDQIQLKAPRSTYKNIYAFSGGNYGILLGGKNSYYENIRGYNQYYCNIHPYGITNSYVKDAVGGTTRSAPYGNIYINNLCQNVIFYNTTLSGSANNICIYDQGGGTSIVNSSFLNSSFSNCTTKIYQASEVSHKGPMYPILIQETGSDGVEYLSGIGSVNSTIEYDSSAECRSGKCIKVQYTDGANYKNYVRVKVGTTKVTSSSADLTLAIYLKKDGSWDGRVDLVAATDNGRKYYTPVEKTITASWAQYSITIPQADLTVGEYLTLFVDGRLATAGYFYIDDFSVSQ